jgi:ketosteroid isomerase-like protein
MRHLFLSFLLLFSISIFGQYTYEPNDNFPFGQLNPDAPKESADFEPMIGKCNCKSETRNPDGTWKEAIDMTWTFKYIMNGMGVQDETHKSDGIHSGSIRQFNADSSRWYVHYYSSNSPNMSLSTWEGNKKDDKIILYKEQKATNGLDGFYRLTFYDINETGYKWIGEWVDTQEKIVYPTWKISCVKESESNSDLKILESNIEAFSQALMKADYNKLVSLYTSDAKIFPNNREIITGEKGLKKYWTLPDDVKTLLHKVTPSEIIIENNIAYDYGIYEGKTLTKEKKEVSWKGKYVIVWKKIDADWKIYLDIWNRIQD